MDTCEKALRQHLNSYLAGSQTLNEFQDWFMAATWNIEAAASAAAVELARDIELVLAEASGGYLTRDELRSDLSRLAQNPRTEAAINS